MKTSSRMLSLLSLLQARRDWPGPVLAERLGVSVRTVRRDVDRLRELGYRVAALKGVDGGYRLEAGAELPPLLFDDEQAVALAIGLRVAAGGAGIEEAAARALTTVRQLMPARLRHRIDSLELTVIERPTSRPTERVDSAVIATVSDAIHAGESLRFDYADAPDDAPPRRAEPHHLITWGGRWYLVAWDLDRDAWRTFRVDRMAPRVPNGPRFTPRDVPGGDLMSFVASRFRGGAADWPCRGEVVLDLPVGQVSAFVDDGIVEPLGPARTRLVLGSWSWIGLAASLGRFDAAIEVVGPAELRDAFAVLADRYAAAGH